MKWFNWFKEKKNYPEFWEAYIALFNTPKKEDIRTTRFIVFDTETTGFDKKIDRILSIGAVEIIGKTISISQTLELYLKQEVFNPETVKIHGLLREDNAEKISEIEAIILFLDYIKNDIIIAHHAGFDKGMVNEMLLRHGLGKLKNKFIDTAVLYDRSLHKIYQTNDAPKSLDFICNELYVPIIDRHTATGDALITALVFLKITGKLQKLKKLSWGYLLGRS